MWLAVQYHVLALFRGSFDRANLPRYCRGSRQDSHCWKKPGFTHEPHESESDASCVKGQDVLPISHVKVIGVDMNAKNKYKEHTERAS